MRTHWSVEEVLDLDANYIRINGSRAIKLREIRDGVYRAIRMPGCSLGDYFAALTWAHEQGYNVI